MQLPTNHTVTTQETANSTDDLTLNSLLTTNLTALSPTRDELITDTDRVDVKQEVLNVLTIKSLFVTSDCKKIMILLSSCTNKSFKL